MFPTKQAGGCCADLVLWLGGGQRVGAARLCWAQAGAGFSLSLSGRDLFWKQSAKPGFTGELRKAAAGKTNQPNLTVEGQVRLWKNRNTYLHTQAPGVQLKTLLLSGCTTAVQLTLQAMPQRNPCLLLKNVRHQSRATCFSLRKAERGTKSGANGNKEELHDPHIHPNLGEHSCRRRT